MQESLDTQPERIVKIIDPCSLLELLGGIIPDQPGLENYTEYNRLASTRLFPLIVEDPKNETIDYLIIATALNGKDVNGLFHFAAPSKTFGYDTNDIRMDWTNLFSKPENSQRLEAHRRISGWNLFETKREQVLDLIESRGEKLVPVIHLRKEKSGHVVWVFDEQSEEFVAKIHAAYPQLPEGSRSYLSILGPCLIAAYAPNVTKGWANIIGRRGYNNLAANGQPESTQNMGATQTLPLTIGLAKDLLATTPILNLLAYCDSGVLPTQSKIPLDEIFVEYSTEITQTETPSYKISEILFFTPEKQYKKYDSLEKKVKQPKNDVKETIFKKEIIESISEEKIIFKKEISPLKKKVYSSLAIGLLGLLSEK